MSNELHVIVGAGPVGSQTARRLAADGHRVKVVTRSGSGPKAAGIELVAADAGNATAMREIATGASALYNCANPPYHRWPTDWPPIANALLATAEATGAVLVTMSNLYAYGPVAVPMTEGLPLNATDAKGRVRAAMWLDAKAAHDAGRVRATEARAADYIGPEVTGAALGERVVPRVLAGKSVKVLGRADVPHSWTAIADVVETLVTIARDERAWGRAWHVPGPTTTQREAVERLCAAAGVAPVKVGTIGMSVLKAAGLFSPVLRELQGTYYQFDRPFVVDAGAVTRTFGITATPLDDTLRAMVEWYRASGLAVGAKVANAKAA